MIDHWLLRRTEDVIRSAIKDSFPIDWREEYLVRSLLRKLRDDLKSFSIESRFHAAKIDWSIYQNTGLQEQNFGDIGLLARFSFADGRKMEGVAYLEAKKRTRGKETFDEIRVTQLKKFVKNAPRASLLLFDYAGISGFPSITSGVAWLEDYFDAPHPLQRAELTYAATIPINTALALGVKDMSLYGSCSPFSHQLLLRYLHGLDLEFDRKSIEAAQGFADKLGAPRYLMVVDVIEAGAPGLPEPRTNSNRMQLARDL